MEEKTARPPVAAHLLFERCREQMRELDLEEKFTHIFRTNFWDSRGSHSGPGSAPDQAAHLRSRLPELLKAFKVTSLLDLPCGDFAWMNQVELALNYTGADIVEELIERNKARYTATNNNRHFLHLDLTCDDLPRADLVLCRDCLVHLSFDNIFKALANIKKSGTTYLLTTTFLEHHHNLDIEDGDWRLLNLQKPPFSLPEPLTVLVEGCTEEEGAYADKALGLWKVIDLPGAGRS
ncbi:MAG: class I SAM-dependent methyltransferase [Gemmatimonadaceae bacterium]|nr:class I SAM-dependent methyltransferase [Gloeobacterales cyanobacterium ES-bin-141]